MKPVLYACIIAIPLSRWAVQRWLDNFAYKIDLSWSILAITVIATSAIAALTVGYQSVHAALINPARALKSD